MKIGFFGHSAARWDTGSASERINKYFSEHTLDWHGVPYGSVQRMSYDLEKHCHKYDLLILFYSSSSNIYCPSWDRDLNIYDMNRFLRRKDDSYDDWFSKKFSQAKNIDLDYLHKTIYDYLNYWLLPKHHRTELLLFYVQKIKHLVKGKHVIHAPQEPRFVKQVITDGYFSEPLTKISREIIKSDHYESTVKKEIELYITSHGL